MGWGSSTRRGRGQKVRALPQKFVFSGMARVRLAELNGPKWTSSGQNGPKWTILVHFGLGNAKIQFGIRPFLPKWSFGPFWTILVQYTFRQYRGHSLVFLGFRGREPGMSQEFCRDVPDHWRCSKCLCKKSLCALFVL